MFIGKFDSSLPLPEVFHKAENEDICSDEQFSQYKDKELTIYFLGVLYNKDLLEFNLTENEAEIIARLYKKGEYAVFSQLDGSFTIVLCRVDGTKMIVRDHHGTHSSIYYNDKYFASSLSLLQDTPDFSGIINYPSLSTFLHIGYIPTPFSAFKDVKKQTAGSMLVVNGKHQQEINLFNADDILPIQHTTKSLDELSGEYGQLHRAAIGRRIKGNKHVGILLSGGYDSGGNLAALRSIYDGKISSYSIGFKGDNWSELPLARCMSETFHTIHHEYEIDGSEITALPEIVRYLGEPFVEGGLMVNYAVMRMIGEVKPSIILGGDGSDQYFGTSGREVAMHYLMTKYGLRPFLKSLYVLLNRNSFEKNTQPYRVRFHVDKIANILEGDLFGFPNFLLKQLLQEQEYMPIKIPLVTSLQSFEHLYTQHLYKSDIEKIINQVILFKASRMASMFGNHLSFPYMDNALYQFLMRLPVKYKCRGNSAIDIAKGHCTTKFLLKYHYKPQLPNAITSKKKQGGFAPMPLFFKDNSQRSRIAEFILSSSIVDNYLKRQMVEKFIYSYDKEINKSGNWFWYQQNKAIQYFNLLTLAIWWEEFVNRKSTVLL